MGDRHGATLVLMFLLGIWTEVPMQAQQALYPQNLLPIKVDSSVNSVCLQVTDIVQRKQSLATSPWRRIIVD